jgi:predicted DNA-binding transcriptional regulator AlpA
VSAPTATLAEVRTWPGTVDVATAARVIGISRSHAYVLIKHGEFPAKTIKVGSRVRVITASLVEVLSAS